MRASICAAAVLAALCAGTASAAVTDVVPNGFTVSEAAEIAAPPAKVYAALIDPARWWNSDHTYSHDASHLTLEARAGGCFCETLPDGGSVQHMSVVYANPGHILRLTGMLGPFQDIAGNGVMTWTLTPVTGGTQLEVTYQIAGYMSPSLIKVGMGYSGWSKAADRMLADQTARLKRYLETGSPQAAKAQ
jgi:uncharacterized protein YndB with AHSA1/START domain